MDPVDNSVDARLIAARRYLSTVPLLEDYAESIAVQLGCSAAQTDQLRTQLRARGDQIEALHVAVMLKHFTAAEIEGLTQFQSSALGRRVMAKMGTLQAELVPALLPLLRGAIEAVGRTAPGREGGP